MGNITRVKAGAGAGDGASRDLNIQGLIRDYVLSAGAKVLFLTMWHLPESFYLSERNLAKYLQERNQSIAKSNIHKLLDELEGRGYVAKVSTGYIRDNGVTSPRYEYTLHERSTRYKEAAVLVAVLAWRIDTLKKRQQAECGQQ